MSPKSIKTINNLSKWGGFSVTFIGIVINFSRGNDPVGNWLSAIGVFITLIGLIAGHYADKNQKTKIANLEKRVSDTEKGIKDIGTFEDFRRAFDGDIQK